MVLSTNHWAHRIISSRFVVTFCIGGVYCKSNMSMPSPLCERPHEDTYWKTDDSKNLEALSSVLLLLWRRLRRSRMSVVFLMYKSSFSFCLAELESVGIWSPPRHHLDVLCLSLTRLQTHYERFIR